MSGFRRRTWSLGLLAALASLVFSLAVAEGVFRWLDGYRLWRARLERPAGAPEVRPVIADPEVYGIDRFVADFAFSRDVEPEWIYDRPDPPVRGSVPPSLRARAERGGYTTNFVYNEHYVARHLSQAPGPLRQLRRQLPLDIFLFRAEWGSEYPTYRFLPDTTLTTGLVTNSFGWRGGPIALQKPPRTIRIACLGSSTTVSAHGVLLSYPELLGHWLRRWAAERGHADIDFEVINAGREGISSASIAAILRYEVLPLRPDYVIYYEGSNQFNISSVVKFPATAKFGRPPKELVPNAPGIESTDSSKLDRLSRFSAVAARLRSVSEARRAGTEPAKPANEFRLPDGIDERNPHLDGLGDALNLGEILSDLDQMKADADAAGARLALTTFKWLAFDGMVLDPVRHRFLYVYLNRTFWPTTYRSMERAADFQNQVFARWARERDVPLLEVAERMPDEPDLFSDAVHNTFEGLVVRAWIVFEELLPSIRQDIRSGRLPSAWVETPEPHPYISPPYVQRFSAEAAPVEGAPPSWQSEGDDPAGRY